MAQGDLKKDAYLLRGEDLLLRVLDRWRSDRETSSSCFPKLARSRNGWGSMAGGYRLFVAWGGLCQGGPPGRPLGPLREARGTFCGPGAARSGVWRGSWRALGTRGDGASLRAGEARSRDTGGRFQPATALAYSKGCPCLPSDIYRRPRDVGRAHPSRRRGRQPRCPVTCVE